MLSNPFSGKTYSNYNQHEPNRYFPKTLQSNIPYSLMKKQPVYYPSFEYQKSPFHKWEHKGQTPKSRVCQNPFTRSTPYLLNQHKNDSFCNCPTSFSASISQANLNPNLQQSYVQSFDYYVERRQKKAEEVKPVTIEKTEPKISDNPSKVDEKKLRKQSSIINKYVIDSFDDEEEKKFRSEGQNVISSIQQRPMFQKQSFGKKSVEEKANLYQTFKNIDEAELDTPYISHRMSGEKEYEQVKINQRHEKQEKISHSVQQYPQNIQHQGRKYYRLA